ncbi:hypothetical protein QR680_002481 [Steinernema hermaphroditum]|uniref:Uncharacterized protein n=1 Tax=Steinernema hermaphroditum TaxID=289476 RepID=A0AA39H3T0_9BILA|nr:hypothetical protein QR680_002481 [Steinernema hermaphroditum]
MQGLPRYDAETFRSLRRVENPSMQIFPSVHVPGEPNLQELAVMPGTATPLSYTSRVRPLDNPLLMKPEPENWSEVLFKITDVGIHRFYFLMNRLPGIAMLMISTWLIWGRGAHTVFYGSEKGMSISAIVAGIVIIMGSIFGSMNHNDSKKRAHYQIIYRLVGNMLNVAGSIVVLVFAAVAVVKVNGKDETESYKKCKSSGCYSPNERLTLAAVLIGLSIAIVIISALSFVHAAAASYRLRAVTKKSKKSNSPAEIHRPRIQAAFNNPAMIGESEYY